MQQYVTTQKIILAAGLVGLSEKQASRRGKKLKKTEGGVYEILALMEFKKGEEIGLEDGVADGLLHPPPLLVSSSLKAI